MPKPRYDEERDETRHGAVDEEQCEEMEKKYNWDLKAVEQTEAEILAVDCVFDGYQEFPPSGMDLRQGDLKEKNKDA
jgi:hypothetical protein